MEPVIFFFHVKSYFLFGELLDDNVMFFFNMLPHFCITYHGLDVYFVQYQMAHLYNIVVHRTVSSHLIPFINIVLEDFLANTLLLKAFLSNNLL